jgi:hypothetical protein
MNIDSTYNLIKKEQNQIELEKEGASISHMPLIQYQQQSLVTCGTSKDPAQRQSSDSSSILLGQNVCCTLPPSSSE